MLATTLENLLNRGLPRSTRARDLCAELAGRRVLIETRGIAEACLRCDGQRVEVTLGDASGSAPSNAPLAPIDARVSGGPFTLLGLSRRGAGPLASHDDVEVSGDAAVAERFLELVRLLAPDPEEELALAIGDVPAHELARFARAALGWWRHAAATTVRNVAEYLAHERGDLVSRAEGRQLATGIDAVHDSVERLEARLNALAPSPGTARQERREPR
ncbi:MAG: ubiquinone biosynthesis accessory factor UbiJ [Steroidobacteraceae bacterium]